MRTSEGRTTRIVVLLAVVAALWAAPSAGAVHQSHHGPFLGTTSQHKRIVMRVLSHTRLGIRVAWRATCESGSVTRITRFRHVAVDRQGRFFKRNRLGVAVRGKIGFDSLGNPVFPEPFSFANNEAEGRLRAVVALPERGRCSSGIVRWDAHR